MAVDASLDLAAFMNVPDKLVYSFKSSGQIVVLVSYSEGTIESIPVFDKTKNLPSFGARLDTYFEAGGSVQKTRDLAITLGIVTLCSASMLKCLKEMYNSFVLWKNKTNSLSLLMVVRKMMGK